MATVTTTACLSTTVRLATTSRATARATATAAAKPCLLSQSSLDSETLAEHQSRAAPRATRRHQGALIAVTRLAARILVVLAFTAQPISAHQMG